jgi:Asp-tRNA(Asn)/Glu-tRNA(Gln) amidotransferase A subunit family amidase
VILPMVTPGTIPQSDDDIAFAPLVSLSTWLREGLLSSTGLTGIYLQRLARLGPELECVVTLTPDLARAQAKQADEELAAGHYRGPLHGVPWAAKDLLDTAGIATTWGATPYRHRIPDRDSAVVRILTAAGAVLVAKTTLGALAYGDIWFPGRTRNPWNTREGSAASSAGSAAAVAAGSSLRCAVDDFARRGGCCVRGADAIGPGSAAGTPG